MATWDVTTAGVSLEFDTVNGTYNSCYQIDTNHFINFYAGSGDDGYVQVFEVNTTTWAVTTAAASLEFDMVNGTFNSCYQVDTNHFINFWYGVNLDGYVQVFTVELPVVTTTTTAPVTTTTTAPVTTTTTAAPVTTKARTKVHLRIGVGL